MIIHRMVPDFPTTAARSSLMKRVRQSGTDLEQVVAEILTQGGFRFRRNVRGLPGSPDFAHKGLKTAIFVNGCYWHGHGGGCPYGTLPRSNRDDWSNKLRANRIRDQRKADELRALGFRVFTVWQCDLDQPGILAQRLTKFLEHEQSPRPGSRQTSLFGPEGPEDYRFDAETGDLVRRVKQRSGQVSVTRARPVETVDDGDFAAAFDLAWLRERSAPDYRHDGSAGVVRVVDLFSGCGGMTLGVAEAAHALGKRVELSLAADINLAALQILTTNLHPDAVEERPIQEWLNGKLGDRLTAPERRLKTTLGHIDVLLGGPPCQGHSDLNNHTRRADPKNALYERMARFAEVVEPKSIIIENVPGVVYDKRGVFHRTVRALEKLGYSVTHGVVRGETLGVPQTRHRAFVVASHSDQSDLSSILERYVHPERSFDWACRDLWLGTDDGPIDQATALKPATLKRLDYLFDRDEYDLPDSHRPDCHRLKEHSYVSVYGRIRGWRPAPTITTGFTVMGQGRFVHPYVRRTLTPREGARLQFFPTWFDFGNQPRQAYVHVIGNAVPPKMIYPMALELLR